MLDKDLIPQPHLWTMRLLIGTRDIDVLLLPPVGTDDIIHRSIVLDPAAPSPLKAIEDAVYDNPLLLNQYREVSALIDTDRFILLPDDMDGSEAAAALSLLTGREPLPGGCLTECRTCGGCRLFFETESSLAGFLRRTFYNIALSHPLVPVIDAAMEREAEGCGLIMAGLRGNRMDAVAVSEGRLLAANIYSFDAVADAAYYLTALRAMLALPPSSKLQIWADPSVADSFTQLLVKAAPHLGAPVPVNVAAPLWRSAGTLSSTPLPLILQTVK